jgi:hypothetical protein
MKNKAGRASGGPSAAKAFKQLSRRIFLLIPKNPAFARFPDGPP